VFSATKQREGRPLETLNTDWINRKTTLALLGLKVNCAKRKMFGSFIQENEVFVMKQVNWAEQRKVKKCRAYYALFWGL